MLLADIQADLDEYADFEEVGSVARAHKYMTAAKRWLQKQAESASNGGSSYSMGKSEVAENLRIARLFVAANASTASGASGRVRFLGVGSNFR